MSLQLRADEEIGIFPEGMVERTSIIFAVQWTSPKFQQGAFS